ncbi:MAG: UDP-glucuronate 4-epimerase [Parvicella sp.]|jgi:UDP-glucuronate 4-epimerase
MAKILITGAAGFIGFHQTLRLLERGDEVIGLDNINDYYDINVKYGRLTQLGIAQNVVQYNKTILSSKYEKFKFIKLNLEDKSGLDSLFSEEKFDKVINLAAQAGVRYSLENPQAYISSNIVGFVNVLEACRYNSIKHLAYASSSSVYGINENVPFSTHDNVDHPISLYAATKKSNELMAHTYSHLFGLPTTGLRFFTVYGPWGRPDMALFLFTKAILEGKPIQVFNQGDMSRDFTYVADIVTGIEKVLDRVPTGNSAWNPTKPDPSSSKAPYRVYNIGNSSPIKLVDFIDRIEKELGVEAEKNFLPIQPGDVANTYADVSDLEEDLGYKPKTSIEEGIKAFIEWYKLFYKVK